MYVAVPGIRNYLEYGGHGLLVFDIDNGHQFVKRIPTAGLDDEGRPLNVKGICANAETGRLYISTLFTLIALDLKSEEVLWEKRYEGGCDRMALSPDGRTMYLPSLEKEHWYVVDAFSGDVLARIVPRSGAHNTVYGPDGRRVYLAGLRSNRLAVADTATHALLESVGPFSAPIRPFTINGKQTLCFVNVNELLGFEIGDLTAGEILHRVQVDGFERGPVKRHGCPSHGIAMTPDERELWVCDATNERVHLFDAGAPAGEHQAPGPAGMDNIQHRRTLCLPIDGGCYRFGKPRNCRPFDRRKWSCRAKREVVGDCIRSWHTGPGRQPVRHWTEVIIT